MFGAGLGSPWEDLEEVAGKREIWAFLLNLMDGPTMNHIYYEPYLQCHIY